LFRSLWFADAVGSNDYNMKTADIIYQPDGSMVLPALSANHGSSIKDLEIVLKKIHSRLGEKGIKAMEKFTAMSELAKGDEAEKLMSRVIKQKQTETPIAQGTVRTKHKKGAKNE
jgi:hypothetical protein